MGKEFIINAEIDETVLHSWFHGCETCTQDPKLRRATYLITCYDLHFELLFSSDHTEEMHGQKG